ncbi:heavy-metal-associated domain-containing protein [Rhodobium gokarnense]|uniref:Copper chaperone CopZ n=1 Tax=Rhodobium gokarnense TaxID=364296 RepID=A0ABT3H979_9HYPH|nr:heavy-metal-associated domain-containing protein [Rhodobium gokarnense]MCW2306958.1 copper chaperone CopZ [Rhodobium gokarnense]
MNEPADSDLIAAFWRIRPMLRIAHHIPGRIRLSVSLKALASGPKLSAGTVEALLARLEGITAVRINRAAGSATVTYDPKTFPPDLWSKIVTADRPAIEAEIRRRLDLADA